MGEGEEQSDSELDPTGQAEGIEGFRRELLEQLPHLFEKAIRDYSRFASGCSPDEMKAFVAYQAGCRVALAHIHLLVKLAHWAREAPEAEACSQKAEQLDQIVREAEAALQGETFDLD